MESLLQQTSRLRLNVDSPEELRPGFETKALVPVEARPADFQQLGRRRMFVDAFHSFQVARILCRRLRRLPLQQLAPSLPILHAQLLKRESETAVKQFWAAVSRRVLVNCGDFPLASLSFALPELHRLGHLTKVSQVGKVVRGLARQAVRLRGHGDLLPFLTPGRKVFQELRTFTESFQGFSGCVRSCCIILQRQLAISKPQAAGCWAGRLYRMLTRCLPPALADAPPGLVIPWMEFYAEYGLVNNEHLELWEKAAESLSDALLSQQDEVRLLRLHDRVPLWIVECLPEVTLTPESVPLLEHGLTDSSLVALGEPVGLIELNTLTESSALTALEPAARISAPMYQKSPPVPVLWHTSPETYERGLSRMGGRQLVLALRYTAADGAGTATTSSDVSAQKALSEAKSHAEKRAVSFEGLSAWPRRHRSRSRARLFVAALLTHLMRRMGGVRSKEACSAVKSLASLKSLGLLGSEAAEALQALIAGPLAGWKVATGLTPSDVSLLLQGMASLVAQPEGTQLEEVARNALVGGGAVALIELTACAIQERAWQPLDALLECLDVGLWV